MAKFNLNQLLNEKSVSGAEEEPARRKQFYKVIPLSVYDLVPSKDNFYSTEQIEELKMSIEMFGVKQNLTVKAIGGGKYRIIAGHRRRLAALALVKEGKTEFEYVPCGVETEEDEIKERLLLITTNSTARQLSDWEKIKQAEEMRTLLEELKSREKLPGRLRDLIAEALNTSPAQIGRMEAITKNLTPKFKDELKEGRVNISAAYELSGLPEEQQKEAYEEYKEKGAISIKDAKAKKQEKKQTENSGCPMNKDIPLTEAEVKKFCKDGCSPSCGEELAELLQKKAKHENKNKPVSSSPPQADKENLPERDREETLKMYCIYNGFIGEGAVRAYCVAKSEKQAQELAEKKFYEHACNFENRNLKYPEEYWKRLEVTLLCDDVSQGYCGEVSD